jgi:DNA-binding FadR family transcriptional regulator
MIPTSVDPTRSRPAAPAPRRGRARVLDAGGDHLPGLVHLLGREIVAGGYPEGQFLPPEAEMLARYGVSRTALREAYGKLAAKGLIAARPKVGTHVRPRLDWNLLDPEVLNWLLQALPPGEIAGHLYDLRRMIEPGAAEMAAANRSAADADRIAAAFRDMQASVAREADLVEADLRFHLAILQATQNPMISAFAPLIRAAMVATFRLGWLGAGPGRAERMARHGAVADAIRAGDRSRARQQMESLLDESIRDVAEALAARPERSANPSRS